MYVAANTCNSKQAVSPACTKNRTHLPTSSQFHDLQTSQHSVTLIANKCYSYSYSYIHALIANKM